MHDPLRAAVTFLTNGTQGHRAPVTSDVVKRVLWEATSSRCPVCPGKDTWQLAAKCQRAPGKTPRPCQQATDVWLPRGSVCLVCFPDRKGGRGDGLGQKSLLNKHRCRERRRASRRDPGRPLTHTRVLTPAHTRGHMHVHTHVHTRKFARTGTRLHTHVYTCTLSHVIYMCTTARTFAQTHRSTRCSRRTLGSGPPGLSLGTGRGCPLASPNGSSWRPRGAPPLGR